MPRFNKERLDLIKKSYKASNIAGDVPNGYTFDAILNTIKDVWNLVDKKDPDAISSAENSTIAYYLAMKSFSTIYADKLPQEYSEYMNDMENIFNEHISIPEKQLNAIDKTLGKSDDAFDKIAAIDEDGSTKSFSDLKQEETDRKYGAYNEAFTDTYNNIVKQDSRKILFDNEQVSNIRNITYEITENSIKDAIEYANSLNDSNKSMNDYVNDKDTAISQQKRAIKNAQISITAKFQTYAGDLIFNNKKNDQGKQNDLYNNVMSEQIDQRHAQAEIFKQKCGTYLASKKLFESRGFFYKLFKRSAYKEEKEMVNTMKIDLQESYGMNDEEITYIEHSRIIYNNDPVKNTKNLIQRNIRIGTDGKRMEGTSQQIDNKVLENINLVSSIKNDQFYADLRVAVTQDMVAKTMQAMDGNSNQVPQKGIGK